MLLAGALGGWLVIWSTGPGHSTGSTTLGFAVRTFDTVVGLVLLGILAIIGGFVVFPRRPIRRDG